MICLDIPMPDNCGECRLMAGGWCRPLQGDSHLNRYAADMEKRPGWCPLEDADGKDGEAHEKIL